MHKNDNFNRYYRKLSELQAPKFRNEIIEACGITEHIFYNWIKSRTEIPDKHIRTIARITGKEIDELFPPKIYSQIV